MLKKLIKYDLENIFKFLIIFYSLALFFAILTRIFNNFDNSLILVIIHNILNGITISMIFNIIINNLMRLWIRFKNNFYGDESYLTHTLPVTKKTLYQAKALTAIISLFASFIVIGLTLFIAGHIDTIKTFLIPINNIYGNTFIKILVLLLFILCLEFGNILQSGYTGIILGHRMNNLKTGYSVLFGFITFLITQLFTVLSLFIIAIFNTEIMALFTNNTSVTLEFIETTINMALIIYTSILIILYFINVKIFKQGVNVD